MTNTLSKKVVAAFDFDGTLSYCDSLLPFLWVAAGPIAWFKHMFVLSPAFVKYIFKGYSRQEMKEKVLTQFFKGMAIDKVDQIGDNYAADLLPRLIKPQALARLKWHQAQHHECVLISASLDVYLAPWAEDNGFQQIITSSLEVDANGFVTGKLHGENCRGKEKVRRLQELLGSRDKYLLYAYGDSPGDKELMEEADFAYYRKWPEQGEKEDDGKTL